MFRVGQADEQLPNAGISHLVEHLAFSHDHSPDTSSNGATGLTTTTFYAWGDPDTAAGVIHRACLNLTRPPTENIDQQRSIILTEEGLGRGGPVTELLTERYGARAHGIVGYRQLGLYRLGARDVLEWSAAYYTADNAVLCATGIPPGRLTIELPRGRKLPAPRARPVDGPLPRWAAANVDQVGLSVVTGHQSGAGTATRILERRLYKCLRHDLALSYAVVGSAQMIDAETMHGAVIADCQREAAQEVTRRVTEMAEDLAEHGPTQAEVREDLDIFERNLGQDSRAMVGWMMYAAECYLNGIDVPEFDDYIEERRQLTSASVRAAWARAYSTAIYIVPPWVNIAPQRMARRTIAPLDSSITGKTYHQAGVGLLRGGSTKVTLGSEALAMMAKDGSGSVRYERAEALIRHGPLARTVIDSDGATMTLNGAKFANGAELIAQLDARIPRDRWIDIPPSR